MISYMGFAAVYPVLRQGSTDDAVNDLQQALVNQGYSVGSAGVDGSFGPSTLAAVQAFQRAKGLPSTGVVDAATWYALIPDVADPPTAAPTTPNGPMKPSVRIAIAGGAALVLFGVAVALSR